MNIDAIEPAAPRSAIPMETVAPPNNSGVNKGFMAAMGEQLSEANSSLLISESQLKWIATGDISHLHQAMVALEEASIRLSLVTQVRNKLLDGYHEILKMQI